MDVRQLAVRSLVEFIRMRHQRGGKSAVYNCLVSFCVMQSVIEIYNLFSTITDVLWLPALDFWHEVICVLPLAVGRWMKMRCVLRSVKILDWRSH